MKGPPRTARRLADDAENESENENEPDDEIGNDNDSSVDAHTSTESASAHLGTINFKKNRPHVPETNLEDIH